MAMSTAPSSSTAGSSSFPRLSAPWPFSSRLSFSSFPLHRSLSVPPKLIICGPLQATTVSSPTAPVLKAKPCPETGLWERYLDWIYQRKDIGLYLDVSRISFSDLEGGPISNSDEKQMAGHYWLLKPHTEFLGKQIDDALDRVSLFAADIVSGKIKPPPCLARCFTEVLSRSFGGSALRPQFVFAEALAPGNPPLKAVFDCNGLLWPSGNVNMYSTFNIAMLKIVGYAQGARGLNGLRDKHFREPPLLRLKAASRSESREETNEVKLEDAKKALIRAVANTNRGKDATFEQRNHILKMINELENANPTKNPVKSPLLSGYWSLLYTAPVDESTSDKYAGTQEGPFLARIKPLAFGSIRQTRSSQVIDVEGGIAKNIADFTFLGKDGTLTIKGNAAPSSVNGKQTIRLDVIFEEFSVRIGAWTSPNLSLQWINPQGWVDTTFLDEDMRVGRGDKGSVFVSVRVKM